MSTRTTRIEVNSGTAWIEVERQESRLRQGELGTFLIVANSLTASGSPLYDQTSLGFIPGEGAESIDQDSDALQCFGISTHVKVGDTSFQENIILARDVNSIKKAVTSIVFEAYCPGDI